MSDVLDEAVEGAFGGMRNGPQGLVRAIRFQSEELGKPLKDIEKAVLARIGRDANSGTWRALHQALSAWDWEADAAWVGETKANTSERRMLIHEKLGLGAAARKRVDEIMPFFAISEGTIIEDPEAKGTWYTAEFRKSHDFYWKRLKAYLQRKGFAPNAVNAVDAATTKVIERLGDPAAKATRAARGLVVGYVQSGKTTNFTGVMAKAIDAGYRLIIVLSGTTNLLRNQTQRRLDMELVGKENILRGGKEGEVPHDYVDDKKAWQERFISYGGRPGLMGSVDIMRLTGLVTDFSAPDVGISPLEFEFEKLKRTRPLWDRENLDHAGARVAVIKKQKNRLQRLLRELKSVGDERCAEIPTLIIDDESDQASVDTLNPAKKDSAEERSAINGCIVDLLRQLKRAQYVGYTATPFANVFVNPDDPADIYPKDFIYSLNPPDGYMGARHFHDFDGHAKGLSNEDAHVRAIGDEEDERLEEALDAFVLTAALKVFREKDENTFPHHTMLVHASPLKHDHQEKSDRLRKMWDDAGYDSNGPGLARLKALFDGDFRRVWEARGKAASLAYPAAFAKLMGPLGTALERIRTGPSPVLMVNSAEGAEVPDFREPVDWKNGHPGVWKIVVGGAKLSRGYTVEGLTVSHFQRPVKMQDTLMQMGRWFGYRAGYRDLVRLYIGRAVDAGKGKELDLYEAFEAVCRDEEAFREQLSMYDRRADGSPGITPKEVPALVYNSYPDLRPTAKNKMFNAMCLSAAFKHRAPTSQASSGNGLKANERRFRELFRQSGLTPGKATGAAEFDFLWSEWAPDVLVEALQKFQWEGGQSPICAEVAHLAKGEGTPKRWLVVMPMLREEGKAGHWKLPGRKVPCVGRSMVSDTRFKVFSSPEHVQFAKWLVGDEAGGSFDAGRIRPDVDRGVLVLYPTRKIVDRVIDDASIPVMAFFMVAAGTKDSSTVVFSVRNKKRANDIAVDVPAPAPRGRSGRKTRGRRRSAKG